MKHIVKRFYSEIWNQYDKSLIPELLHADFTFHGSLGVEKRGHSGFVEYVDFIHNALGEYHCDIQEIIHEDNKVFARLLFTGIHKTRFSNFEPTGKTLSWQGAALFTIENDKIINAWILGDKYSLLEILKRNANN